MVIENDARVCKACHQKRLEEWREEDRADALGLQYRKQDQAAKLMDVIALATSLALDFAYTGRLIG